MTEKISAEMFLEIKVPKGWNFKERKWGMKKESNAVVQNEVILIFNSFSQSDWARPSLPWGEFWQHSCLETVFGNLRLIFLLILKIIF